MLLRVTNNLYLGNTEGLVFVNKKDWCIIHACQSYHYKLLGWSIHNRPKKDDRSYLIYENKNEMSLNWVDGPSHLYDWYGPEKFSYLLNYIEKYIKEGKKIFIHCDQGKSRSPSLALLFLAKRDKSINNGSFQLAYNDFIKLYPQYSPRGIALYIENKWLDIL